MGLVEIIFGVGAVACFAGAWRSMRGRAQARGSDPLHAIVDLEAERRSRAVADEVMTRGMRAALAEADRTHDAERLVARRLREHEEARIERERAADDLLSLVMDRSGGRRPPPARHPGERGLYPTAAEMRAAVVRRLGSSACPNVRAYVDGGVCGQCGRPHERPLPTPTHRPGAGSAEES